MADTHFLSSIKDLSAAIHLATGIFWTTSAYTARAGYWGFSSLEVLPRWGLDCSVWLDVGCNLVFAYGCWRAHQAIFLLLPDDRRGRVRRSLAWTPGP